jgi:hypothetical protein
VSSALFFDDLVTSFYEKLGSTGHKNICAGQICKTHICYSHENREVWRPDNYDGTQTRAEIFKIVAAGTDAYKRRFPLGSPKLETDEEFPVIRAKRRPVLVIRAAPSEVKIRPLAGGSRISWPLALVVPIYSVEGIAGEAKFPPAFIERARFLEFPEFLFLPDCPGVLDRDSILPLFRLTNVYQAHLEPTVWRVSEEVLEVLLGQMKYYLEGVYDGKYATARELLLKQGPSK